MTVRLCQEGEERKTHEPNSPIRGDYTIRIAANAASMMNPQILVPMVTVALDDLWCPIWPRSDAHQESQKALSVCSDRRDPNCNTVRVSVTEILNSFACHRSERSLVCVFWCVGSERLAGDEVDAV